MHQMKATMRPTRCCPAGRRSVAVLARVSHSDPTTTATRENSHTRRAVFGVAAASVLLQQLRPALAAEAPAAPAVFSDPTDSFSINVPPQWAAGEGMLTGSSMMGPSGGRRTVAWFPTSGSANTTNVSVVISNTSPEFTSMGSFGDANTWGENLVNSLDRSWDKWSKTPVQVARLVKAVSVPVQGAAGDKGYIVEYTVLRPGESEPRHLISVAAIAQTKYYNRLYTATAQCLESELPKWKKELEGSIQSFRIDATRA